MRDVADPIMPEDIHKFLIDNKEAIIAFLQNIPSETSGQARKARSTSRSESRPRRSPSQSVTPSPPPTGRSRRRRSRSAKSRSSSRQRRRTRSRSESYSSRTVQHPKNSSEPRRYYNSHTSNGSASHGSRRGREHRDPTGPRSTVIATEGFEAARWRSPRRNSPSRRRPSTYASSTRAAPPSRCLGVFGMNPSTNERDLNSIFSEFGRVEQVQIIRDRFSNRSRGFGFVYFRDVEDAQLALPAMVNAVIDGYKVRVDFSLTNFSEKTERY